MKNAGTSGIHIFLNPNLQVLIAKAHQKIQNQNQNQKSKSKFKIKIQNQNSKSKVIFLNIKNPKNFFLIYPFEK